jgi:hypothetical protein
MCAQRGLPVSGALTLECCESVPTGAGRAREQLIALQQSRASDYASPWRTARDTLPTTVEIY